MHGTDGLYFVFILIYMHIYVFSQPHFLFENRTSLSVYEKSIYKRFSNIIVSYYYSLYIYTLIYYL